MVQRQTVLKVADNSGAKALRIIGIPGSSKRIAYLGDVVNAVVDRAETTGVVKDSEIVRVVIVRVRKEQRREDGSYVRFDDNAGVIIDNQGVPRGTRIFGPIAREVRDCGYTRITSLAQEVV
ncbi:MAG: 50S ribosomal protein L14 [Candidatus Blackburnbacteria bacterium RIFCSPHIGHO2_01_FULL_43_15b]|uniref:Large ribosomal subunit protein uL14 n=1 Tax=Candidatus Blackburnbacteria bacterium RIFCSPHIGHO2_01_FULL_43_15b TaxID=1797513 RepID=A0A1G1UZ44_9BACT|nr:MAG: 50S ribosomal protein L14 [Candidatus Blackburnbacteria bacterium RIFCSPHIGHO2_01_FULL_43_15b]